MRASQLPLDGFAFVHIRKLTTWVSLGLLFSGTAWAGGEIGWSHSTLTGQEASQRFLSDSEQCMEYARLLSEAPAASGQVAAAADADQGKALKRQELKKAIACMSARGWSTTAGPRLNAGS